MSAKQEIININLGELLDKVCQLRASGYRLVQISCTKADNLEINYSFDKDYYLLNLKVTAASQNLELPSISSIYWSAFIYENEMHDLFGVRVKDMVLDYAGNFYRTKVQYPFIADTEKKDV